MKELTILTLFGGRWNTLDPFLKGLLNLDWPVKGLKFLWYTNAEKRFVECLKWQERFLSKRGYKIRLIEDGSLKCSALLHSEMGAQEERAQEHVNVIAALYNAAWQHVETDDVVALEDDVVPPSHALRRFASLLDRNPKAALVSGCVFDRHRPDTFFVWELTKAALSDGAVGFRYEMAPAKEPWGVRKVSATGLSCTWIRRPRLPKELQVRFPFKVRNGLEGMSQFGGCDIVLCLETQHYGKEVWCDFDVRPYHVDSKGRIH
jgi:hypothetical protein